jgi:hypothetical protein
VEFIRYPAKSIIAGIGGPFEGIEVREEEILELAQFEEIMFLVPEFSPGPTHGAGWLFYFPGFQVAATSLVTFISPCGSITVRT